MKTLPFILLSLIIVASASGQETFDKRLNDYDVQHYTIRIIPSLHSKTFSGVLSISAKIIHQTNEIILDASNTTLTIDSVTQIDNGQNNYRCSFKHQNNKIDAQLCKKSSDNILLNIFYHGTSDFNGEFNNGGIFFAERNNNPYVATSSEPNFARKWFPCKDIPSDKATAKIIIEVPESLTVASNGNLINATLNSDSTKTFAWETKYPISTYLISFDAGVYTIIDDNYETIDGKILPIKYYVYPEYVEQTKDAFKNTNKMLAFMENKFGPYPFSNEKYGIAMVPGELTMENQTITSIQDSLISTEEAEPTLIHELSHQWWGNMITPLNWHHTWLNEGFATYTTALYYEYYLGKKYYHNFLNQYMSQPQGSYSGSIVGQSDTSFWDSFSDRVYYKGAIVLHMLRKMVGDSSFFKILKHYSSGTKFKYSNVTTEDFIKECENFSGQKLDWFFNQWVYAKIDSIDRPKLSYNWNSKKSDNGYKLSFTIKQLSSDFYLFRLPLEITVATSTDTSKFKIINDKAVQQYEFNLNTQPLNVELDKDNWIFKELIKED
jgi:aminopeptidase N